MSANNVPNFSYGPVYGASLNAWGQPASYSTGVMVPATGPTTPMGATPTNTNTGQTTDPISATPMNGWDKFSTIMSGIGSIGKVYAALQANRMARDNFGFQKQAYESNLANQLASYNMALEDRAYARAAQNNQNTGSAEAYIARHRIGG